MEIQCNKLMDNAVFIETTGRMDASMAPNFEAQCRKWIEKGATFIVADMENLEYLSSAGLRSILVISKLLKQAGGKLLFCGVKGSVKEIFEISGFASIFDFYDKPEQALAEIK